MNDTALAFKRGFAEELASRGLTPSMVEAHMEKQANPMAKAMAAFGALGPAAKLGLGAWLLAPVAVGGIGGYAMGNMEGPESEDIKALHEVERVNNIRRAVNALKRQQGIPV